MIYNGEGDLYELRNFRTKRASFFEYDHAGRCMASKEREMDVDDNTGKLIGYGAILSSYGYQYDECNNLTKLTCSVLGSSWSTVYTYDGDNRASTTTLSSGKVLSNTFDALGRLQKRTLKQGNSTIHETTLTYVPGDATNKTTGLVAAYQNGSDAAYSYEYDAVGNIKEITQGTTSISYVYDEANRLIRENNSILNQTITYEYDTWGNILNRKVYAYTVGDLTNVPYTEIEYEYTNTAWGDQLKEYNGQTIAYDEMGNPTTYRGYTFDWRGKQLVSANNGTNSLMFEYNEDGLRQQKTCNNITTDYYYNGSVLIGMQRGQSKFLFSYDASGNVVSVKYNNVEYYYLRNAQGDIVKLIDGSGDTVVEYVYDTWGKKVSTTGSLAGTLGLFQPFRYRGYVYDFETGFYYLQSRYYDPTTGRFISADILLSTGQGVLGHNCYAYCLDNPASLADYTGFDPVLVIGGVAISLETIIIVCALIVLLGYYVAQNDYIVKELRISIGELIDNAKQSLSDIRDGIRELLEELVDKIKANRKHYSHPTEVHHIVLQGDPLMKHTQSILIKVGILIDSNENKVSIDTQLHKYLHTTAYKAYIILGVEIAYRSGGTWNEQRDNVLEFLRKVKAILEMASDTVKYLY